MRVVYRVSQPKARDINNPVTTHGDVFLTTLCAWRRISSCVVSPPVKTAFMLSGSGEVASEVHDEGSLDREMGS
jgi:hypothetical protein